MRPKIRSLGDELGEHPKAESLYLPMGEVFLRWFLNRDSKVDMSEFAEIISELRVAFNYGRKQISHKSEDVVVTAWLLADYAEQLNIEILAFLRFYKRLVKYVIGLDDDDLKKILEQGVDQYGRIEAAGSMTVAPLKKVGKLILRRSPFLIKKLDHWNMFSLKARRFWR